MKAPQTPVLGHGNVMIFFGVPHAHNTIKYERDNYSVPNGKNQSIHHMMPSLYHDSSIVSIFSSRTLPKHPQTSR